MIDGRLILVDYVEETLILVDYDQWLIVVEYKKKTLTQPDFLDFALFN